MSSKVGVVRLTILNSLSPHWWKFLPPARQNVNLDEMTATDFLDVYDAIKQQVGKWKSDDQRRSLLSRVRCLAVDQNDAKVLHLIEEGYLDLCDMAQLRILYLNLKGGDKRNDRS